MKIDPETQEEINRLYEAVDEFAAEMKARLREQAMKGYGCGSFVTTRSDWETTG